MKLKRHGGSLNHPRERMVERETVRDDKTNMSRVALSAQRRHSGPSTAYLDARASLRSRIPTMTGPYLRPSPGLRSES